MKGMTSFFVHFCNIYSTGGRSGDLRGESGDLGGGVPCQLLIVFVFQIRGCGL